MDEKECEKIIRNIDKETEYRIEKGLLYRLKDGNKAKVARKFEVEGIMYLMHDHELSAHFGIKATYEKVREKYWWKNMRKDVENYVKSCDSCQRRNNPQGLHELHSIEVKEPFYMIGIDVIGPLPETEDGNKYIVVAMDYFTKWPEAKAIKKANAAEISKFIYEEIICRHGCPRKILTDNGTEFNNQLIKDLTGKLEIQHKFSTPYHPKTNGLVERFNKTMIESLAKLITGRMNKKSDDKNWDKHIAPILFAYRSKIQNSSKMTPFYLTYGRKIMLPDDEEVKGITMIKRVEQIIEELPIGRYEAKENIKKSQEKQKEYHDKIGKRKQEFQIGDKVLYFNAAKSGTRTGKLEEKWKGPYYIHEVIINGSYKIKELDGKIFRKPVNGELLKEYFDRNNLSWD